MHDTNTASFAHSSTLADVLKDPVTGYVSYNDLKFVSGLPYGAIFAYVAHRLKQQTARPSVNRLGDHVYIKFLAP